MTNEKEFECLRAAVRLAKDEQIPTVRRLYSRLLSKGFERDEIRTAIKFWAEYEKGKKQ